MAAFKDAHAPADAPGVVGAAAARPKAAAFSQYKAILAKDLRQEVRTREMVTSMGLYALLVLIVYGAALGATAGATDTAQVGGGLLWAMIVFTSLLGLGRSFAREKENNCLEGIMLAPLDRGVIFLAKATANLLFLAAVEVIAVPVFWFLFMAGAHASDAAWLIVLPLALGTVGIAAVGTLLSTITANTRGKDVMLAVLFIPIAFPLLYACASATTAVIVGADGWLDALRIGAAVAGGYDIIMALVSWVLYDYVVSA